MFLGFIELEETLNAPVLLVDAARVPVPADFSPGVRIYGPLGLIPAATTVAQPLDTGTITGASNASPIVITSANHELTDGTYITVSGVLGNTAANGSWVVTAIDASTFSLGGSTGNGSYTAGGSWAVAGLYLYAVDCTAANGFEVGTVYYALITATVAGVTQALTQTFIVT